MKVYMFHDVHDAAAEKVCRHRYEIQGHISPDVFEAKLKYLIQNYTVLSLDQFAELEKFCAQKFPDESVSVPDPGANPDPVPGGYAQAAAHFRRAKYCLLTFDDGLADHYHNVLPIMKKYNVKGSFFVSGMPLVEKKICGVHKIQFIIGVCTELGSRAQLIKDVLMLMVAMWPPVKKVAALMMWGHPEFRGL